MRYAIIVILIIFFGVVGTIFLIGRGNRKTASVLNQPATVHAADYVNNDSSSVRWIHEGRLLGDDRRRAIQITVTPTERKIEILEGYNRKVGKSATFPNDKTGYTSFLLALENLNFGRERKVRQPDERGMCPLGFRYIYEIKEGANTKTHLWSDSCNAAEGTFAGTASTTRQIFKNQIPQYEKFVSGVQL